MKAELRGCQVRCEVGGAVTAIVGRGRGSVGGGGND